VIEDKMNYVEEQRSKAQSFRAMHTGGKILILPNAWDVASARVFEEAGFGAVASTSAGVAFALGYPDGQKITRDEMLSVVARIASRVKVPVTADVEAGYGDRPEDVATTARAVLEAGAVGMNLEDATGDPQNPLFDLKLQLEKIGAVREAAENVGVPLVLNARTDVYLAQVGPPERRYDESIRRLSAYREAGADCVFLPGVRDAAIIQRAVNDLKCPINILVGPGSPTIPQLEKLGVARVSLGSSAMRATLGVLRRVAAELRAAGTYTALEGAIEYAELNKLMQG
jgi:2-methylisocitrate lyase-like PEP mutase family enzyme